MDAMRTLLGAKGGVQSDCARGPSAAHAGRPSAWCGGVQGGFTAAAAATVATPSSMCMLTPVHTPHFSYLADRVQLTYALAIDGPPTLVAVFDTRAGATEFCKRHSQACGYPQFYRLSLEELVGPNGYPAAKGMLRTGGWQARERQRDRMVRC